MKIFIIYASAGFGHQKIAEAINEVALDTRKGDEIKLFDILDHTNPFFRFIYSKGYIFTITKIQWLWSILFFLADTKYLSVINRNLRCYVNSLFCSDFLAYIKNENPDYVISTHFLVNELVSSLKKNNQIKTKLVSVVTDFGVHDFWIADNIDMYVAASDYTKQILIDKRIKENKITVLGLPVRRQFTEIVDPESIKRRLGLNSDFTVLMLTGGVGIGPIIEVVEALKDSVNIIVICGKNLKLCTQLKEKNYKNLVPLCWIDNVHEIMAASDLLITKPGGSSIYESLIMGLPMVFFCFIPGQESQNAKIMSELGLGFIIKEPNKIRDKVIYFKDNPQELDEIKKKILNFRIKNSATKILELLNE